jgi:tyrosine-protein kinase Etk/Wzc
MYESFDAFEYVEYLRRRWRVIAAACIAAALISFAVSLLITKRYTATASLVIEPPGGSDARGATAVSAVYLESLKTYERFAASDTLFARAAQQFHLQDSGASQALESLKRRVLKVSKLRDTKILEISVSLPDPRQAQSVAQYLAEETVKINRGESLESDRTFVEEASQQLVEIQARLERAQKGWTELAASSPVAALSADIDSSVELQGNLRQQLVDAQANVAEYQQQAGGQFAREQLQAAQARSALIEKRLQELNRDIQQKSATLAARNAKRDLLQTELKVAQAQYEAGSSRVRELRATAGTRAEQLRVIDPGIVPQRPSSPNIPLNVGAAVLLALVSSIVYLSVAFVYRRRPVGFEPAVSRGMRA